MDKNKIFFSDSMKDEQYMSAALDQAEYAYQSGEVPVGAVIIDFAGTVIARGYNKTVARNTQTAHAELEVIAAAGDVIGDWRLEGCMLYVTLEPCPMCMHAILLSRLSGVVFGARSPRFGYGLDNAAGLAVYKKDVLQVRVYESQKSIDLLQSFFRNKRRKNGWSKRRCVAKAGSSSA